MKIRNTISNNILTTDHGMQGYSFDMSDDPIISLRGGRTVEYDFDIYFLVLNRARNSFAKCVFYDVKIRMQKLQIHCIKTCLAK